MLSQTSEQLEAQATEPLTARELDVVRLLMTEALSDKKIAERLVITPNTVHFHLAGVMRKMGVCSRTEVVAVAWQRGLNRAD